MSVSHRTGQHNRGEGSGHHLRNPGHHHGSHSSHHGSSSSDMPTSVPYRGGKSHTHIREQMPPQQGAVGANSSANPIGCHHAQPQNPNASVKNRENWAKRGFYYDEVVDPTSSQYPRFVMKTDNLDIFRYRKCGTEAGSERVGDPTRTTMIESRLSAYRNDLFANCALVCLNPHMRGNQYNTNNGERAVAFFTGNTSVEFHDGAGKKLTHTDPRTMELFSTKKFASFTVSDLKSDRVSQPDGRQGHLIPSTGRTAEILRFNHIQRSQCKTEKEMEKFIEIHQKYNPTTLVYDMGTMYWVEESTFDLLVNTMRQQCIDRMPWVDLTTLEFELHPCRGTFTSSFWVPPAMRAYDPDGCKSVLEALALVSFVNQYSYAVKGHFIPGAEAESSSSY